MRSALLGFLLFFPSFSVTAYGFDRDHAAFTAVLQERVENGLVDYEGLKKDPASLDAYLTELGSVEPSDYSAWGKQDQIAFWINAYNAYTLKAIIENYPIKASFFKSAIYPKNSIRQIDGVWDEMKWAVNGEKKTLDEIEHEILRKKFNEPNIHMALVCAAMSCPPLRNEAYVGEKLQDQFRDQAKTFLANPQNFKVDYPEKHVFLSSIFKWFGEDFVPRFKGNEVFRDRKPELAAVLNYVSLYADGTAQQFLLSGDFIVSYLDYDWSLNEQP